MIYWEIVPNGLNIDQGLSDDEPLSIQLPTWYPTSFAKLGDDVELIARVNAFHTWFFRSNVQLTDGILLNMEFNYGGYTKTYRKKYDKVLVELLRRKFNKVIEDLNIAIMINHLSIADCTIRYPTTVSVKGTVRTYTYDTTHPIQVQRHGWKFIYKLLKPLVYANPTTYYPIQVKHDYFMAHLKHARVEKESTSNDLYQSVRLTDKLQYEHGINGHAKMYDHKLHYLKWLQDDLLAIDMEFSNGFKTREFTDLPERFWSKTKCEIPRGRFHYLYMLSASLFAMDGVVVSPSLWRLEDVVRYYYFTYVKDMRRLSRNEMASIKRIGFPESHVIILIPPKVSMLICSFI